MPGWNRGAIGVAAALALVAWAGVAGAAIKVRKPVLLEPEPAAPAVKPRLGAGEDQLFVGSVIFAQGGTLVAEIPAGARKGERFVVFDEGLRRAGKARVDRELEKGVYLLRPQGSLRAGMGAKLARESEREAAARVVRTNRIPEYLEFLDLFPDSKYRDRVAREVFRLRMKEAYPTFPGTTLEGRLTLAETLDRKIPLGQVLVKLDRFIIARTDDTGRFRIEGIPSLPVGVRVTLDIKSDRLRAAEEVSVELPAEKLADLKAEIPVKVAPTVLAGQVLDERGAPVAGVEVWTSPYTMEVLTDETGAFRIARRKVQDGGEGADQPLFGGDYDVFAFRRGYAVGKTSVSAESYRENPLPPIRLERLDLPGEPVPPLGVNLTEHLAVDPGAVVPEGAGPRLNP
ncbi:MAG: carboxypeptidase regulatory-like domain-containing protein [Candidatus Dadabacteria bacterium]|nr:MAG: carboxypeptidase regulatory-like domain-containing protein [Candidatus Dadabacteria bacterium]